MRKVILSVLMCAGMLVAQMGPPNGEPPEGPRGKRGPGTEALQAALDISAEQAQALAQFAREQRRSAFETLRNEGVMEQLRANRQAMRELRENGSTDPEAYGKLVLASQELRARMREVRIASRQAVVDYVSTTLGRGPQLADLEEAAKQAPAVREATALGLLIPPEGARRGRRGGAQPGAMGFRPRGPVGQQ